MFKGFGQEEPSEARYVARYQEERGITPSPGITEPGGSVTYLYGSNTAEKTSGLLPILESIVKAAPGVATAYYQAEIAKAQAKAGVPLYQERIAPVYQRPATIAALPGGISLSNLLLIGGLGLGVVLLLRRR